MWEGCDLAARRRGHLGQDCSPHDQDQHQKALVLRPWRAWLPGSAAAGEQLAVGAGLYRGRCAGGELRGVGPAEGGVGTLAGQDA